MLWLVHPKQSLCTSVPAFTQDFATEQGSQTDIRFPSEQMVTRPDNRRKLIGKSGIALTPQGPSILVNEESEERKRSMLTQPMLTTSGRRNGEFSLRRSGIKTSNMPRNEIIRLPSRKTPTRELLSVKNIAMLGGIS